MRFYLGTHEVTWLARAAVPLFVSRRRLAMRRSLPRAIAPWALDSGGFTELAMHGRWTVATLAYAAEVRRFRDDVGQLDWASIMDWVCAPPALAKTGLTVLEHQRRTIRSFLDLKGIAPDLPWAPVLQGWELDDYLRHADAWERVGVRLHAQLVVGVGSVAGRQHEPIVGQLFARLHERGLRTHGFGLKVKGLAQAHQYVASADSMAWSYDARRRPPLPGHTHGNCANCMDYALAWRAGVLSKLA